MNEAGTVVAAILNSPRDQRDHGPLEPDHAPKEAGLAAARARGRLGGSPRKMDRATLQMAMAALADPKAVAAEVAKRLGLTTTLYTYVNGDGSPKAAGQALLDVEALAPCSAPQAAAA